MIFERNNTNGFEIKTTTTSDELIGYSDVDWARDLNDHHSTSGNLFMMAGGALTWLSKKTAIGCS